MTFWEEECCSLLCVVAAVQDSAVIGTLQSTMVADVVQRNGCCKGSA